VATTRAKKRLYLTATLEKKGVPSSSSLLALMWPVEEVCSVFTATAADKVGGEEATESGALGVQTLRRLPSDYVLPEYSTPLGVREKAAVAKEEEKLHTFDWAGETRRRVGTVTHAFLQAIAREGIDRWNAERVESSKTSIRTALVTEGVGPERLEGAAAEVAAALKNCLTDERGRWILGSTNEAAAELAVTAVVDGRPKRLKIDRTFVQGEIRWLVDFKTTDIEGGDSERYFNDQVQKYRADLEQYARALRLLDRREVRCALYFPLQKELRLVPTDIGIE
jgi:ATP-dependent helicase/nuclease subunit A